MPPTDRELLHEFYMFMVKRNYIKGDPASVKDMVLRYQQPPLTLYHRVCMQMTIEDYNHLTKLLERVVAHFQPTATVQVGHDPGVDADPVYVQEAKTGETFLLGANPKEVQPNDPA